MVGGEGEGALLHRYPCGPDRCEWKRYRWNGERTRWRAERRALEWRAQMGFHGAAEGLGRDVCEAAKTVHPTTREDG